jgi:hypothetical protein
MSRAMNFYEPVEAIGAFSEIAPGGFHPAPPSTISGMLSSACKYRLSALCLSTVELLCSCDQVAGARGLRPLLFDEINRRTGARSWGPTLERRAAS